MEALQEGLTITLELKLLLCTKRRENQLLYISLHLFQCGPPADLRGRRTLLTTHVLHNTGMSACCPRPIEQSVRRHRTHALPALIRNALKRSNKLHGYNHKKIRAGSKRSEDAKERLESGDASERDQIF